jgi:hypothetical protein
VHSPVLRRVSNDGDPWHSRQIIIRKEEQFPEQTLLVQQKLPPVNPISKNRDDPSHGGTSTPVFDLRKLAMDTLVDRLVAIASVRQSDLPEDLSWKADIAQNVFAHL